MCSSSTRLTSRMHLGVILAQVAGGDDDLGAGALQVGAGIADQPVGSLLARPAGRGPR